MLAADEIAPEDDEAAVATGFLVRNWYALNHEPVDAGQRRAHRQGVPRPDAQLLPTATTTSTTRSRQDDYFRFRAFFEPIGIRQDRVPGEPDPGPFQEYEYSKLRKIVRLGSVRIFDKTPEAPTWFYTGGDERNRVKERGTIAPGVPAFLGEPPPIRPVDLPPPAFYPGLRPAVVEDEIRSSREAIHRAESDRDRAREAASRSPPEPALELARTEAEFANVVAEAEAAGKTVAAGGAAVTPARRDPGTADPEQLAGGAGAPSG